MTPARQLLLLGGGHAHLGVLRSFAQRPPGRLAVTLVSATEEQWYSGMLPGHVAGHYRREDLVIDLPPLARAAGVAWLQACVVALDAARRCVTLHDGRQLPYDLLSIDTGGVAAEAAFAGAGHALSTRPLERFVTRLDDAIVDLDPHTAEVVVIGAGAAGFELALALRHRLPSARVTLLSGDGEPLQAYPPAVQRRGQAALAQRGVRWRQASAVGLDGRALALDDGSRLPCDLAVLATGASAPAWLQGSGLALDADGWVRIGATLQSASHAEVLAAGDVATRDDVRHPRSGVHAVRAGPVLADNLRRLAVGRPPRRHRPPARTLNLLACGDQRAIAAWGAWSAAGGWVWRWKDAIDRAFMARHRPPHPSR